MHFGYRGSLKPREDYLSSFCSVSNDQWYCEQRKNLNGYKFYECSQLKNDIKTQKHYIFIFKSGKEEIGRDSIEDDITQRSVPGEVRRRNSPPQAKLQAAGHSILRLLASGTRFDTS